MKFSTGRIQKFITVILTLHIIILLYFVYLNQSEKFAWIVGALSLLVFISYILSSGKLAELSTWLSTIVLAITSICILFFLKENSLYLTYHTLLPIALIFYLRKEPIYLFTIISIVFYTISFFMNEQIHYFSESFTINGLYILWAISISLALVVLFVMRRLYTYVNIDLAEEVIVEKTVSPYLDLSEIPYIFYLKAIADNITSTALEIRSTTLKNSENISKEKGRLLKVLEVANVMEKTFYQTIESINITKDIIEKTLNATKIGEQKISDIMEMVNKMMKFVDITKKSIYELTSATKKVEGVIHVIDKIAGQTRLLSLNASIEGARFAIEQAGFTMVSKEVKQLAALTHLSVQDITNTMRDINSKTKGVQSIIYKEGREALEGLEVAKLGEQSVKYVVRMMESIKSEVFEISDEMLVNKELADKISENFETIKSFLQENFEHMEQLSITSYDMKIQGDHLAKIIHAGQISEMLSKQNDGIYSILTRFAMDFEKICENAIRRGLISEDILFSREYNFTDEEGNKRYRSKYDGFFESSLQALLDEYKLQHSGLKYFVVMDDEGYVPLANTTSSTTNIIESETDLEKAKKMAIIDKGGVILQDYVSKQAIKSDSLYSLQCVLTSEDPIMDMSIRLHLKDRYWGAVRAGFLYS
ncbi:MAG: methyl-accepting chemotaxis protein [Spirochaetia bacterium]|nr:methyl-accepting chemotaxis protein [Spirochaetia bacterium]